MDLSRGNKILMPGSLVKKSYLVKVIQKVKSENEGCFSFMGETVQDVFSGRLLADF